MVGLALAAASSRVLESLLHGVATDDLLTFVAAPLVLLAVGPGCLLAPRAASDAGQSHQGAMIRVMAPSSRVQSVDRMPGPVVVLLWVGLVAGGYLWTGLTGLVFTGSMALVVAGMARWRPKEPFKTWVGIFWSCWGLFMYWSDGAEWFLTMPAVWALATLTAWRDWLLRAAAAE